MFATARLRFPGMPSLGVGLRVALLLGIPGLSTGCGGTELPPPRPQNEEIDLGYLPDLLPAGAHWVLIASPTELMASPATLALVDALLPDNERDALARRTGVEPAELTDLVLAEYPDGFIALLRGPWQARHVVIANEIRMNSVDIDESSPFERRRGYFGTDRREVAAIAEDVVLVATPNEERLAPIFARASGDPVRFESALGAHASLLQAHEGRPLVIVQPEPIEPDDEMAPGVEVLLAGEQALAISAAANGDRIDVHLTLVGRFPAESQSNFRAIVVSLAESEMGQSLGIGEALSSLSVEVTETEVSMTLSPRAQSLAHGLQILLGNDVWSSIESTP